MNFYDVINKRSSEKSFKDTPICEKKMGRIMEATMKSPSWKNQSSYKIILVNEKLEKEKLAKAVMNDGDNAGNALEEAPMMAVVVGNPNVSGRIGDKEYYLVDGAIAMEHLILAATNEGYGTCWIGAIDETKVKSILNIPNEYKVIGVTPIGEVNEHEKQDSKTEISEHVFINKWENKFDKNKLH
ncbi:nitroreductase family protein [Anaeromicrobium sediminis]|uniref:Nitroreductase n=1 Tax=Anaeromicrobium sediminis TaxID=1478221 RepID=A0A267MBX0_9FIRM|nr:nitroreductase family protein [Anaeromicrobium sediminis]PAB57049.1 nitroreductase [Anaeromicrobium sediminis]